MQQETLNRLPIASQDTVLADVLEFADRHDNNIIIQASDADYQRAEEIAEKFKAHNCLVCRENDPSKIVEPGVVNDTIYVVIGKEFSIKPTGYTLKKYKLSNKGDLSSLVSFVDIKEKLRDLRVNRRVRAEEIYPKDLEIEHLKSFLENNTEKKQVDGIIIYVSDKLIKLFERTPNKGVYTFAKCGGIDIDGMLNNAFDIITKLSFIEAVKEDVSSLDRCVDKISTKLLEKLK